jgi:cephalosporin hydroxylase
MDKIKEFQQETLQRIEKQGSNENLQVATKQFINESIATGYSYNFSWLGRPIIQYPQDVVAMQELVWEVKPDLIIECGIAHGGSLILSASLLAMLDYADAVQNKTVLDPSKVRRRVLGVDIDIRPHNREAIETHPMANRIDMIQGSSIAPEIIKQVHDYTKDYKTILICLDSNHTHDHVLEELRAYAPLTSKNSYCIVFDTVVEDLDDSLIVDRPWGKGNNPKTAVWKYLKELEGKDVLGADGQELAFEIDKVIENKILVSVAPDGYLKRV